MDKTATIIFWIEIICSFVAFVCLSVTNDYDFYYLWLMCVSIALIILISENYKNN